MHSSLPTAKFIPLFEAMHIALDIIGMIPGVGEIADGLNAAIYLAQGDFVNAATSALSLIPMAGAVSVIQVYRDYTLYFPSRRQDAENAPYALQAMLSDP